MAFRINAFKTKEDKNFIYYTYQFSTQGEEYISSSGKIRYKSKLVDGQLKISKENGDVHTIKLAEGDNGIYAQRAAWALIQHWKKGEFPEKTSWAS